MQLNHPVYNLYHLYESIGLVEDFRLINHSFYSSIQSETYDWPKYVFNIGFVDIPDILIIKEIAEGIYNKTIPAFVQIFTDKCSSDIEEILYEYGLRKIDVWPVMVNNMMKIPVSDNPDTLFKVKKISSEEDLFLWYTIVKSVLFNRKRIDIKLFIPLLLNNKFVFVLGCLNGTPVSASLLFIDEYYSGLYMVATMEEVRGRGFGRYITNESIRIARSSNSNPITLQSSRMAYSMYQNIGFEHVIDIDVYWMVGKNFK